MSAPPEAARRAPSGRWAGWAGRSGWSAPAAAAVTWLADLPVLRAVLADVDRGLDAMDESHYLMAAQPWAQDKAFNGVFGWYSGPLLRLVGDDLGALRVLAAALLVAVALVLARAVRRCAEQVGSDPWPAWLRGAWPPALVGVALCYYTVFVRTPSYNWFAALGLMLVAAGLLDLLRTSVEDAVGTGWAGRAPGALVAVGLFWTAVGKATTALAAAAVSVVVLAVLVVGASRAVRGRLAGAAAAGLIAGSVLAVLHTALVASPVQTAAAYRRAAAMLAIVDPGHYAAGAVPGTVLAGLRNVLVDRPAPYLVLLPLLVLAALVAAALASASSGAWPGLVLAVTVTGVWALVLARILPVYPGGVAGLGLSAPAAVMLAEAGVLTALLLLVLRAIGRSVTASGRPGRAALAAAALTALGVVYPVGTNVEYSTQLHGAFPVLVAAAVLGVAALPRPGRDVAVGAVAAAAVLLGAVLVPTTRERAPYRIATLDAHTIPRSVTAGSPPLLLDADTVSWIDGLRALADLGGFTPGTPLLDLTWHPASVLVVDGRAPSVLLPAFPGWPDPAGSAAFALRQEDPMAWQQAWLLVPVGQDDAVADHATAVLDRAFPGDYDLVGEVVAPFDGQRQGLWRPRRPA